MFVEQQQARLSDPVGFHLERTSRFRDEMLIQLPTGSQKRRAAQ